MLDTSCVCNHFFNNQEKPLNVVHWGLHDHMKKPVYFGLICIISFAKCNLITVYRLIKLLPQERFQMDSSINLNSVFSCFFLFLFSGKSRSHGTCWRLWIQRTKGLSRDECCAILRMCHYVLALKDYYRVQSPRFFMSALRIGNLCLISAPSLSRITR